MDIKETGKKLKPFAPVLSVALVTACVAGSLSGYEAPVYAATQEETPAKKEETKEKKEEKKTAAKGSFDLEDKAVEKLKTAIAQLESKDGKDEENTKYVSGTYEVTVPCTPDDDEDDQSFGTLDPEDVAPDTIAK